ncbi:hypothetical protein HZ994_16175 [Akkermansiaceae bacterium]|nr:hypothetical protein HZ994_16175 [Akkermansiaceae bacterium]
MDTIFKSPPGTVTLQPAQGVGDILETCYRLTGEALKSSGAATDQEILKALASVREGEARGEPLEYLETLARIQGHDEERIGPAILALGDAVASTMNPTPPSIPFAGKLIAPSAFYDSFEAMHKLAKALLAPVVFAEDTDAIGTASVNPIAAQLLGEEILQAVSRRFGIHPFITVARLDYEAWAFLCRKHFEL